MQLPEDRSTSLLVGVSETSKLVVTWEILYTDDDAGTIQDVVFCGEKSMQWDSTPSNIASIPLSSCNTTSTLLDRLESSEEDNVAMTVAIGSDVLCYQPVRTVDQKIQWKLLYQLQTDSKRVDIVRRWECNSPLCLVSSTEQGLSHQKLSIWSDIRSNVPPALRAEIEFEDPITAIAWNVSSDGQFILAVASKRKVSIYGEKRADEINNNLDQWISYADFTLDIPEDIVDLAWVDCGALVVAAGNQIRCYLKWLTADDHIQQDQSFDPQLEPMSNIYDESYELNGPLPFYHPNHLIHYLMWGKMKLVNLVMSTLYRSLKNTMDEGVAVLDHVPAVNISTILKLQNDSGKHGSTGQPYSALFDEADMNSLDISDEQDGSRPLTRSETEELIQLVKNRKLPALSESERVHLVAMIDTFGEISSLGESLDENGARFTALLENFYHLNKVVPEEEKAPGLGSRDLVWALHSQSQDLLLERCTRLCDGKLLWQDARALGIFLWLQKAEVVTEQMTMIARNTYLSKDIKDPVDCTLFYLALRKKTLLQTLWRTAYHHKEHNIMVKFLANDFSEPRWQKAAAKNAFVLLGKQRFEYAAAFFLLADKLKDAVGVILKNLKDYHLAIAICRVYDGDNSPLLRDILTTHVLPHAIETNDRWLVSIVYTLLDEKREALRAMVVPLSQFIDPTDNITVNISDSAATVNDPNLFILYQHLKQEIRMQNRRDLEIPLMLEYLFSLNVSRAYDRLGCPMLALYILTKYAKKKPAQQIENGYTEPNGSSAANLFDENDSSPPQSSNKAVDLFSDNDNVSGSTSNRAVDLFADEPTVSQATDIFADEPTVSKATDLFADDDNDWLNSNNNEDIFANEASLSTPHDLFDNEPISDSESATGDEIMEQYDGLSRYKAMLVVRMLQTILHVAAAAQNNPSAPAAINNDNYDQAFSQMQHDMTALADSVQIPAATFTRLFMEKCVEVDAFALCLRWIENDEDNESTAHFMTSFRTGFIRLLMSILDRNMITSFSAWNKLQQPEIGTFSQTQEMALNAYIMLLLTTLKQRNYEKCWALLFNLRDFLESLSHAEAIKKSFEKALNGEVKMPEMDIDDFETFSEDSLFGYNMDEEMYRPLHDYRDKSPGAVLLEAASLNYILMVLESHMRSVDKPDGAIGKTDIQNDMVVANFGRNREFDTVHMDEYT
ncbi:hypothetical protein K492DRAFT_136166 [Lichtheimia hyalospora FSU 10163]|nr:hypothetical protein K492DRAFT_136166 [Lichtheimia hyalospora FSU 10163]